MKKYWRRVPLFLCFLIGVAFSLKNLREPDLWWQLRTGQWILEHHEVPKEDVFSYTFSGAPWLNVKWGFEVLAALIAKIAGPECIFVLQALVTCLILFFLIRAWQQVSVKQDSSSLPLVLALLCTLIAVEYRINGRPEMFSHFFTALFLYLLISERRKREASGYGIFLLVPLQIVWANLHEAFAIGIILTAIFCAGAWLEYFLSRRKVFSLKAERPVMLSLALVAQIASVGMNPYGTRLLIHPLNIIGQVYENKFTTELAGIGTSDYWQWNTYLILALLVLGAAGTIFYFSSIKSKSNRVKLLIEHFGLGYLLALPAFLYLAATAYRNIAFLALVFFPVLAFGLSAFWSRIKFLQKFSTQMATVIIAFQCIIYGLVVSNKYYDITGSHDRYGLEILSTSNPVGAAGYMEQNHLTGRCFSDYLTSSYLLWKLQPGFQTYIDLRDLDVFPSTFFNTFTAAVTYPDEFEKQDSIYHFESVVLYRPQFAALHKYLFNNSRFKLAFVDPVAAVYIPKHDEDSSLITWSKPEPVKASLFAPAISKLFDPFYTGFDYTKLDNDLPAASYCLTVGRVDEAEQFARKSCTNNIENYKGYKMLGDVFYHRLRTEPNPVERAKYLSSALDCFKQAIQQKEDYADAWLGEGAVYFEQRNMTEALACFERCIELDKSNLNAYLSAGSCCNYFLNGNSAEADSYARKAIGLYQRANYLNPNNPSIMLSLGLLYARLDDCDNVAKYLVKIADFEGFSDSQRQQIKLCLSRCGR